MQAPRSKHHPWLMDNKSQNPIETETDLVREGFFTDENEF